MIINNESPGNGRKLPPANYCNRLLKREAILSRMWLFESGQVSAVQVVKQPFYNIYQKAHIVHHTCRISISFSETCDQIQTVKLSAIMTSATEDKQSGVRWGQKLP